MNGAGSGPTTYGHTEENWTFRFKGQIALPKSYVVACGMALFQGPDGHLWFAPDAMGPANQFDWHATENLAAWDACHDTGQSRDPGYLSTVAELCLAVDAALRAEQLDRGRIARQLIPVHLDL